MRSSHCDWTNDFGRSAQTIYLTKNYTSHRPNLNSTTCTCMHLNRLLFLFKILFKEKERYNLDCKIFIPQTLKMKRSSCFFASSKYFRLVRDSDVTFHQRQRANIWTINRSTFAVSLARLIYKIQKYIFFRTKLLLKVTSFRDSFLTILFSNKYKINWLVDIS